MSLQIKSEKIGKSKIKLDVKVPSSLMRTFFAKVYNELAPSVEVQGFRKGHAPKPLTIAAIGENRISQEIINLALTETYPQAIKQEKILPVAPPKVNIRMLKDLLTDSAELEYEAEIDLLPEVKIGDYKKSVKSIKELKKEEKIEVTSDEVDQVLKHLQQQHATFKPKEGPAEDGDRIEMDFEGTEKGVLLENLTSKNYPAILGSKVLVPEFEKNLIGMKKGGEKEFDAEIGPEKDRKKIHFKVKLLDVQEVNLPPLNDELAGKFQQGTMENLRRSVEVDILKQKQDAQKHKAENLIVNELLQIGKIELPDSLIEQETHRMIDDLRSRTSMMGMPFEQYLAQIKKTEADLHEDFHEQAEKTVKIGLILGEIGKQEKIDLQTEDAGKKVMEKLLEYAKE